MCQFCHQHGDGKKWYLKAENYSDELMADMERRKYIRDFVGQVGSDTLPSMEKQLQRAARAPAWLRRLLFFSRERQFKRDHYGQIVPIEDLGRIMDLASSIVRIPCICRKSTTGKTDACYCFGLGLDPERMLDIKEAFLESFRVGPDTDVFEKVTKEEAMELHRGFEKEGLIHSIWTFKTPFIGGLCNCDRSDCLAMVGYQYDFRIFFRSEHVAFVEKDKCVGCRECLPKCQFGAIGFSTVHRKTFIDPMRCYGCGICRSGCEVDAIRLMDRSDHPVASGLW
jgi:Pyruvate/2-oxoacid:ferredoxin oxidoreductase delta subunit